MTYYLYSVPLLNMNGIKKPTKENLKEAAKFPFVTVLGRTNAVKPGLRIIVIKYSEFFIKYFEGADSTFVKTNEKKELMRDFFLKNHDEPPIYSIVNTEGYIWNSPLDFLDFAKEANAASRQAFKKGIKWNDTSAQ